ncbi:hypothetical protein [Streptomyces sp. NPDC006668]|uniref:hypothetical protein n=1 Tax=Streptomyces sp. NPDC006668 TaxID=3156903 RepID=UPI0033D6137F
MRLPADEIVRQGARRMLAAALEAEVNQSIAELAADADEHGRRLGQREDRAVSVGPGQAGAASTT